MTQGLRPCPVYKPQPVRTLEQIRADIKALEKETEGLFVTLETTGTERKHRDR